ncbi:MAG: hypothetical protein C5B51_32300 [Terriglobia bacterium]|nr:MAG: hypothetical protein C5B51_32300 [Terriglobia bacterium]
MPGNEEQVPVPQVTDKRPKILGLLPKNAQARVLGGIALLMVLVMTFSGRKAPQKRPENRPATAQATIDPNQARIQEYRARIEDQARQLAIEEAQLAQTKQVLGVRPAGPTGAAPPPASPSSAGLLLAERPAQPEKNWIELDRQKREYQGLYASNIALTYRQSRDAAHNDRGENKPKAQAETEVSEDSAGDETAKSGGKLSKGHRIFEGTVLETVLTNRLDSSFSGPVNCMVTTDIYARDHRTLLIPQGTRVLGEVRKLESMGEQRLAVTFHRLIMADGYSVSLDQFKGLNQIGETGLRDQVNHHYLQIFGVSVAIGAIAGLARANAGEGVDVSGIDAYEQGVSNSLARTSLHILDRYLNVLPTFTIREGHRIKVYLSQDLMLPAYGEHPVADQ